ncbi:1-acyl-sn-glycerol-3-phosphate acyltransferase [Reichenbachiella ulvae]|uniref:1-acyl-sn-glycerol-3-phosphate acyltransferase n=1 Tax=Reichenbachiella ulvae TaxID=2980104 RepID=A0ABT3CU97_9BACT|nr:1-acyl-sn-glycerol-3-phosphate acyltransferase [Reichenbachiella ulvae]MCV9387194.1 1-acyl-sn-glycerol-3-phosphate acyltransferase [Reichenbachiella ulvae]
MRFNRLPIFVLILGIFFGGLYALLNVKINENLDETLPNQKGFSTLQSWMDKQKNLVVFSLKLDPTNSLEEVETKADSLKSILQKSQLVESIQYKNDIDPQQFFNLIYDNLPIYLEEKDYNQLDSLLKPETMASKLQANKKTLLSPEGIGQRKRLLDDPLGFSNLAFKGFSKMQMTEEIIQNGGYFLSKDRSKLLIKARVNFDIANSEANRMATEKMDQIVNEWNNNLSNAELDYFGTFLIADVNARQIQKDVRVTVSIAVSAILLLLIYYYRRWVILAFFLVPGLFGVLTAALLIYLLQGQISGLALAASAIVFGIVADYSFHFFTHFKENGDAIKSRNEIMFPLLISGGTTIVAFLSLYFADSKTLKDFGLFTSFSLAGTLFFILAGLPYILRIFEKKISFASDNLLDKWVDKIKIGKTTPGKWTMLGFLALSALMLYFGMDVQFENDLRKINYYPESLQEREQSIQNIDPETEQRITILARATKDKSAEHVNERLNRKLDSLHASGKIKNFFSVAPILISAEEQKKRIERWNDYWKGKRDTFLSSFEKVALEQNWKPGYFKNFYQLIEENADSADIYSFIDQSQNLSDLTVRSDEGVNILSTLICPIQESSSIKDQLAQTPGIVVIDNASVVARIVESVKDDFNFLLIYASAAVFIAFLLIYGNLELTLISFIPMILSWVWVLGTAALLDIKFNFINIILTTFIFGLGDDFSIFVTDGLLHRYKYRKEVIGQYKTGIILSSISTVIGTGVLIFAKHPALQSIAVLSVIGIIIIVPITFFIQPVLFRLLIINRTEKGKPPYSIGNILFSTWGYGMFILGSLFSVFLNYLLRISPLSTQRKKHLTHRVLQVVSGFQLDILWKTKKRYVGMENLDFSSPSIIIANHSSFFDILALVRLHPKLVLVVNEWVYKSPLFGPAIRYADYIPSFKNMEEEIPKMKELVEKGYSIAIYPEGKRSVDGKLTRFHKGAFYLAEELKLDITPIILYGHGYVMPKHEYYFKSAPCDTVVLPRIKYGDLTFGEGYRQRTKKISAYFKSEFNKYKESEFCMQHAYAALIYSFYYKSPILPWYFRVKWKFEKKNYENYHQLIGTGSKKIYDLGCGYGYLSYFLWLRNEDREIIGLDYDEEKVALAANSYLKNDQINFISGKAEELEIKDADAIVLADVLHYLNPEKQLQLLSNCHQGLKENGLILIRDGVLDQEDKHEWTKKSEKWSTQLIKFNKTDGDLHFISQETIETWAKDYGYELSIDPQSDKSSNMLFILNKTALERD